MGEWIYHESNNDLYRFLQETLGPLAADSAAASAGVWRWGVGRYQRRPYHWSRAAFDAHGRAIYLDDEVEDSVHFADEAPDPDASTLTADVYR
jgi:hypothetical protein